MTGVRGKKLKIGSYIHRGRGRNKERQGSGEEKGSKSKTERMDKERRELTAVTEQDDL